MQNITFRISNVLNLALITFKYCVNTLELNLMFSMLIIKA